MQIELLFSFTTMEIKWRYAREQRQSLGVK